MENKSMTVIDAVQETLVAERVRLEIKGDRPIVVEGHLTKRIPDIVYKTGRTGEPVMFQTGYGLVLDRPIMLEGHNVQILALTRVKCAHKPESDPFEELWNKEIYVQVCAPSRHSFTESLWLFEQILNSPQETLERHFDTWYQGRVSLKPSVY